MNLEQPDSRGHVLHQVLSGAGKKEEESLLCSPARTVDRNTEGDRMKTGEREKMALLALNVQ